MGFLDDFRQLYSRTADGFQSRISGVAGQRFLQGKGGKHLYSNQRANEWFGVIIGGNVSEFHQHIITIGFGIFGI